VAYHPFLHAALLARLDAFDFVELPLEIYVDPAQSELLDPGEAKLRDIVAAKPCVWHGSVLSLGSVEAADDPALDGRLVERIRRLLWRTGTTQISEVIGFRRLAGRDLGEPQGLPYSATAARWVAARHAAARAALGHALSLQIATSGDAAPRTGWDAATFLRHIVAGAGCDLVLDTADLAHISAASGVEPAEIAQRLPLARIAMLATAGEREADWALLELLCGLAAPPAIVIRCRRNLYPLDALVSAARRAADLLAEHRGRTRPSLPETTTGGDDPGGLAELRAWQQEVIDDCVAPAPARPALAARVRSWQTWRERVADTHKAQQIARFLAQDSGRRGGQGG
jgi:uncharacterized protein (UPF0276 family)